MLIFWVSEHEQVDACGGEALRKTQATQDCSPTTSTLSAASVAANHNQQSSSASGMDMSFFIQGRNREVLKSLDGDVALVAPRVDGRLKDVARG